MQAEKVMVVDARLPVELTRAELALRLATNAGRAEVLTVGRKGIAVTLEAASLLRGPGPGGGAFAARPRFTLAIASEEVLVAAGVPPPSADEGALAERGRRGFRFSFTPAGQTAGQVSADVPLSGVLRVGAASPVLTLAKAVATTVVRVPDGFAAAVETALKGKGKNIYTRVHKLAEAVALAHQWQVAPANEHLASRPFRCVASVVVVESESKATTGGQGEEADVETSLRCIRLTLLPKGPMPAGRQVARAEVA